MKKQTKEKEEPRRVGPKFARNVLPESFHIRRPSSPMADLLDEADRTSAPTGKAASTPVSRPKELTPVKTTPVISTGEEKGGVIVGPATGLLPELVDFIDQVLPRFPPARQAILLRLYRWCDGEEKEMIVSTPKLAAKTNMDEKVCRAHLHALITEGFILRSNDNRGHIARFGGSDRSARGLLLTLSAAALSELID